MKASYEKLRRMPYVYESSRHCGYCGKLMIRDVIETDTFDMASGNPYKFEIRTCPDWERPRLLWHSEHMRVRVATIAEEARRPSYPM